MDVHDLVVMMKCVEMACVKMSVLKRQRID